MSDSLLIFTYIIILMCGMVTGAAIATGVALFFWMRKKIEEMKTVEVVVNDD